MTQTLWLQAACATTVVFITVLVLTLIVHWFMSNDNFGGLIAFMGLFTFSLIYLGLRFGE